MKESEFRNYHSKIIQYYQVIEDRLRGFCAALSADEERNWFERIDDYGTDALGQLIHQFQTIQKKARFDYLSEDDIEKLLELRDNRNYWCHGCFIGMTPVIFKNGNLRRSEHGERLIKNFEEAVEWDKKLAEVFRGVSEEKDLKEGMFPDIPDRVVLTGMNFIPLTEKWDD